MECCQCHRPLRKHQTKHEVYDMLKGRSKYECNICFDKERQLHIEHPPQLLSVSKYTGFKFWQVVETWMPRR